MGFRRVIGRYRSEEVVKLRSLRFSGGLKGEIMLFESLWQNFDD